MLKFFLDILKLLKTSNITTNINSCCYFDNLIAGADAEPPEMTNK